MTTPNRPRRSPPRLVGVLRTMHPSPQVLRVTFGGEALADFPAGHETANVKLLLRREAQDEAGYLAALAGEGEKPLKRTYTVLAHRPDARGHAVIEVPDAAERRELGGPPGVAVHWIVNAGGYAPMRPLVDAVVALDWLPGTPYAWIAGETGAVRELRAWLADGRGLDRGRRYTSGYWQLGHHEDGHQLVKRAEPMD